MYVGGGNGESVFHVGRASVLQDEKISGAGWWGWLNTSVNYLMPLNCVLKLVNFVMYILPTIKNFS